MQAVSQTADLTQTNRSQQQVVSSRMFLLPLFTHNFITLVNIYIHCVHLQTATEVYKQQFSGLSDKSGRKHLCSLPTAHLPYQV